MDSSTKNLPIGKIIENARRSKGLTGARLALQAGCTQSAISQFEHGKTTALKRDTVEKIAKILGIELPVEESPTEQAAESSAPALPIQPKAAFCPNGECPSNIPYTVGDELLLYPRKQPNPSARYCPWCGEVLEHDCPQCQEPATQSAFCPACGSKRIEPPADIDDPIAWAEKRRKEIADISSLL